MNSKHCVFVVVFLAMATEAAAAESNKGVAHKLSIAFLSLCVAILVIALIIALVLYLTRVKHKPAISGGKYEVSAKKHHFSYSTSEAYGVYQDPTVAGSIYLPLDKDTMNQDGNGYAHLETGAANGKQDQTHTYETLKNGSSFQKTEAAYDNPEFARTKDDGSGSEHEYEMAEVTLGHNKPKESAKIGNTSF